MENYDEYQRFLRYRNGHHAFFLTMALIIVNVFLEMALGTGWGESNSVETLVIFGVSLIFFNIRNTFQGSYFRKTEHPLWSNLGILISAAVYYLLYFGSGPFQTQELIVDGKVTIRAVQFLVVLNALSIPITYFINVWVERRKD